MREGRLGPEARSLVEVSAALPVRDEKTIERALEAAAARARASAVEEILLQSHLFLGYPAALGALAIWRRLETGRAARAATGETDGAERRLERSDWRRRGEDVCGTVYGDQYDALRENLRDLHPAMERWVVEDGYGRVLGRSAVSLDVRELAIVALLVVLDVPVQLHSHLRGALNSGADPEAVEETLAVAFRHADDAARERAEDVWRRVSGRE